MRLSCSFCRLSNESVIRSSDEDFRPSTTFVGLEDADRSTDFSGSKKPSFRVACLELRHPPATTAITNTENIEAIVRFIV
jgi:hypothetical protein